MTGKIFLLDGALPANEDRPSYSAIPEAQRLEMATRLRSIMRRPERFAAGDLVRPKPGWNMIPPQVLGRRELHFVRYLDRWRVTDWIRVWLEMRNFPSLVYPPDCMIGCIDLGNGDSVATMITSSRMITKLGYDENGALVT